MTFWWEPSHAGRKPKRMENAYIFSSWVSSSHIEDTKLVSNDTFSLVELNLP